MDKIYNFQQYQGLNLDYSLIVNSTLDIKHGSILCINNEDVDPALKKIFESKDFYSTSMARDLMFHVQEHRFKLPEISKILKNFNLEFLGFSNQYIKSKFSKMFPEDKKNISLENWDKFENSNPNTFYNMYQFWVRKT